MKRLMERRLADWKAAGCRKPILLEGARQTGKTWLVKRFSRDAFPSSVYVSLENNAAVASVFDGDLDPGRILSRLGLLTGKEVVPGETLLVLDEVQEVPRALSALKYFHEDAPGWPVIATGSSLGCVTAAMREYESREGVEEGERGPAAQFPVGQVQEERLFPMTFSEFLDAMGKGGLAEALREGDEWALATLHGEYLPLFDQYMAVGGMPAAVRAFRDSGASSFEGVEEELDSIIGEYRRDFSRHVPRDRPSLPYRLAQVWDSMPAQVASPVGRFAYSQVRKGARGREYDVAVEWLQEASLCLKVPRVTKPDLPLKVFEEPDLFKLYVSDVGLLRRMSGIPPQIVAAGQGELGQAKGPMAEQYVCQQLYQCGARPFTWMDAGSRAELDFLVQVGAEVVPLEVKARKSLDAKSLKSASRRFGFRNAVRLSARPPKRDGAIADVPLWAVESLSATCGWPVLEWGGGGPARG